MSPSASVDDCCSCCRSASDEHVLNFAQGSILHEKTKGGQRFKDKTIAKTARRSELYLGRCQTRSLCAKRARLLTFFPQCRLASPGPFNKRVRRRSWSHFMPPPVADWPSASGAPGEFPMGRSTSGPKHFTVVCKRH